MQPRAFAKLVRHFAAVIINSGQDEGASDLNLGFGGLLAILAVPGAFFTFTLFDKYSSLFRWMRGGRVYDPILTSIPDKYFFIVFSMVVTGIVTVVKWDRIFPSRQDYANLAPLPLPASAIFGANLTAIVLLAAIFAIDVNAASTLLFPMVVVAGGDSHTGYLAFLGAHAASVVLASAFTFFACFAIVGGLLCFLPIAAFRRISVFVRLLILLALLTLLSTIFSVPSQIFRLADHPHSYLRWLPPVWFLAFYQRLQGRSSADLAALATMAWQAATLACGLALAIGALSYRRYFQRIPESPDRSQTQGRRSLRLLSRLLDPLFLRSPFQLACYHFSIRALLRSETHCILVGAFGGLGAITALQLIVSAPTQNGPIPPAGLLAAPLCLAYFLLAGLRLSFELPAGVRANWIYQLTVDRATDQIPAFARKLILTFVLPLVGLPCLIVSCWFWGPRVGIAHTAIVLSLTGLLWEVLLLRFRKIPFACTTPVLQNHAILLILAFVVGYFAFTGICTRMEQWMLGAHARLLALPVLASCIWYGVRQLDYEPDHPDAQLLYNATLPDAVQTLNLSGTRS